MCLFLFGKKTFSISFPSQKISPQVQVPRIKSYTHPLVTKEDDLFSATFFSPLFSLLVISCLKCPKFSAEVLSGVPKYEMAVIHLMGKIT